MKYIIREKQVIFRGWNTDGNLVTTSLLSDATVYDTKEKAQEVLELNNKPITHPDDNIQLRNFEVVEVEEKTLFTSRLSGE